MEDRLFWNNRLRKYGHTGWADFAIYSYDQYVRIKVIKDLINKVNTKSRTALDYGCGIGDFSQMLADRFEKVIAVDISEAALTEAIKRDGKSRIEFSLMNDAIFTDYKYDLIICITVLQHINNDRLSQLIKKFHLSLNDDGKVIILDSFLGADNKCEYIASRGINDLTMLFKKGGLELVDFYNFYHPIFCPTPLFSEYHKKISVKLLNRLSEFGVPFAYSCLKLIAARIAKNDDCIVDSDSMTKIIIFGKSQNNEAQQKSEQRMARASRQS